MPNLKIDVAAVVRTAGNIKLYNTQMRDDFTSVQRAINQLNNVWDGSASTVVINKFNEIIKNFGEARYNELDNYVKFLLEQVGEGYTQTEEANKSLADLFK